MLVSKGTTFLPRCAQHECRLTGELKLRHPNVHAIAVWEFDFSSLHCGGTYDGPTNDACKDFWEVRA